MISPLTASFQFCELNTHSYSKYRYVQVSAADTLNSMITFHHANTRGSRAHKLRIARLGVSKSCYHPRVMSRSLPHLTLSTSTSSLSPTPPISQSFSPSHPSSLVHDPFIPCEGSDLEGGDLRKMLVSPLYIRERGEISDSSRRAVRREKRNTWDC